MTEPRTAAGRALLAECEDMDWPTLPDAILDIEAEARAPLDVERLARALYVIWPNDNQWDAQPVWFREKAEAIAREYAALEEPTPPAAEYRRRYGGTLSQHAHKEVT